jgi:hypothetical protein
MSRTPFSAGQRSDGSFGVRDAAAAHEDDEPFFRQYFGAPYSGL